MDFARKQLEKYGWSEGKGLGRNENGITVALKPKLKFDNTGIGHNAGEQFTNNWWEKIFNNAADNINIDIDNNEIKLRLKSSDSVEITTKEYSVREFKRNSNLEYGSFLKTAKLSGSNVEHYNVPSFSENEIKYPSMTDEELFAACGGRTAHKGARHGLKLGGKLSRIEKQEKLLLKKMRNVSLSDSNPEIVSTEKKLKKLKKQKEENKEKYIPIVEDSMESTSSNGLKKKKKRKNVSFSETVTVAPIYNVDLDTSFESEVGSMKDDSNDLIEAAASGSDEGIEQDIKNNNNYCDNHKSFEVGQFNINDLSKAERKKLKKKRKLEAKQNTSTGLFLQKLDEMDTKNRIHNRKDEEIFVNIKKRKHFDDSVSKMDHHEKNRKKNNIRKKQKKMENILSAIRSNTTTHKLNSIVESLNTSCRISDDE